jgi:ATP-dependent Lhr-like helicase
VALEDVILQLEGTALTASALERDILPARLVDYTPAMLDSLFADGELVWVGAGALGVRDGRVRLVFRENLDATLAAYRPQLPAADSPLGELQHRLLQVLGGAEGSVSAALRWHDLHSAFSRSDAGFGAALGDEPAQPPPTSEELRAALWNLAWSGLITNDSFGPVRAATASANASRAAPRGGAHRPGRSSRTRRRERPDTSGRWWALWPREDVSLGGGHGALGPPGLDTKALIAQCERLLDLYGILARELVAMAGVPGGFAALYPVLRTMEERGSLRRGYFVEGLGAAQFAREGVADQLRNLAAEQTRAAERIELGTLARTPVRASEVTILEVTDPGCVWGAVIPWPEPSETAAAQGFKPQRAAPVAYLDRRGRSWWTFAQDGAVDPREVDRWIRAVTDYILARERRVEVRTIDGLSVAAHPLAERLVECGFASSYRGMSVTRPAR